MQTLTTMDLRRNLGHILDMVAEKNEPVTISRANKPLAVILSVAGPFANPIDWYVAADLYISASKIEGNPLGPMEALSNCTPLLLSKIEGHTIFADNALLFMADNLHNATEDLKLKLNEILLDLPVVDEKKWSFAKTQWSTNCMFKKYSELYI